MKKSSTKQAELSLLPEPTQGGTTDSEALAAQVLSDFLADGNANGADLSASSVPAQADLFVVMETVHDWPIKDDVSTMEFPIFSLSKKPDTQIRTYSRAGKTVRVIPSALGAATLFDKDLLIYCISHIVKAADAGMKVGRRLKLSSHPFLVSTKRSTGGTAYEGIVDMCRRLKGTTIETNVKTNEQERTEGFGLIEDYKVTQYTKNGKGALELEVTLSDWLYRAAISSDILTLHPGYFSLGQALERRLYELGRKHCGQQAWFCISLPLLQEKAGSVQEARYFKQEIKGILKANRLPDFKLYLDTTVKPNQLVYVTRDSRKLMMEATQKGKIDWLAGLLQQRLT